MMIHPGIILLYLVILHFFVFDRKLRIAVSHSVSNCVGILVGNVLGGKMVLVKWLFSPC